ncbi:hypothetical protein PCANC_28039 [Puccinia coronata f. sp. avenae]|uniref:Uncharacterized protein n=1 Tax=Puccinia coronata f. sp. avenae TaxID=200324 RepID=A0A2N5TE44_9BASI|nr:hypothetical protein PCANC_28039 [Puccinia coronata f. sp. avenae]
MLMGHKHYVLSVAVSRNGKWISCKIRGVQFWDPKNCHGPVHVAGPRELGYLLGEQVNLLAKLPARQAGLPAGQAGTCCSASQLTCWPSRYLLLGEPVNLLAKQSLRNGSSASFGWILLIQQVIAVLGMIPPGTTMPTDKLPSTTTTTLRIGNLPFLLN